MISETFVIIFAFASILMIIIAGWSLFFATYDYSNEKFVKENSKVFEALTNKNPDEFPDSIKSIAKKEKIKSFLMISIPCLALPGLFRIISIMSGTTYYGDNRIKGIVGIFIILLIIVSFISLLRASLYQRIEHRYRGKNNYLIGLSVLAYLSRAVSYSNRGASKGSNEISDKELKIIDQLDELIEKDVNDAQSSTRSDP